MHYSRFKISDYIELTSRLMMTATKDAGIVSAMTDVGYNTGKIGEGKSLYDSFIRLTDEHAEQTQLKLSVNKERTRLHQSLKKEYMKGLKIARIAFQDDVDAREVLLLDGERERDMELWFVQVEQFIENLKLNQQYLAVLAGFGVKADLIEKVEKKLELLKNVSIQKEEVENKLRLLTQNKKTAMVNYQKWVSDYVKMARIRFDNDPKSLTALGILND